MRRNTDRPPRGGHPTTDVQQTAVGVVLFTIVMGVLFATVLYPPVVVGVGIVAVVALVGRGLRSRSSVPERTGRRTPEDQETTAAVRSAAD